MGCYTSTLAFLESLGTRNLVSAPDTPISFVASKEEQYLLRLGKSPAPGHPLMAILRFSALGWGERLRVLRIPLAVRNIRKGESVAQWLSRHGQDSRSIRILWGPLCVAVMNEEVAAASAEVFARALRLMLFRGRENSTILVPRVGLSELLVRPALARLSDQRGTFQHGSKVEHLIGEKDLARAVVIASGESFSSDYFIFSIPPWNLRKVSGFEDLPSCETSPIVSCYVWLDAPVADRIFRGEMTACIDSPIHWLFRKSSRHIQTTTSAAHELVRKSVEEIGQVVTDELERLFPQCRNRIRHVQVLKERKATMSTHGPRANTRTRWRNVYLAGDWVNTGLPLTIESAVRSAESAVEAVLAANRHGHA